MKREDLVALSKDELIEIICQLTNTKAALEVARSQIKAQTNKRPPKGKSAPGWVKPVGVKMDRKP